MSRVAALEQPGTGFAWRSAAVISIVALLAIGFFAGFALPYLMLDQDALARYLPRRWWLLLHVAAGAVALLTGPLQLWLGLTRLAMPAHRRLGLVYVASVGVGALASFYLAAHTALGWVFGAGLTGLGIAWIVTTALAIAAVRRRMIEQHREWMIRSYVVTFAFVTFRALVGILQAAGVGTLTEQLAAASWFCWALPLLVTEAVLQGRKIFGVRRAATAAIALTVLMAVPALVHGQARLTGADLDGYVRDESGGVLPDAAVTVVNADTNVARAIETDVRGRFRALALPPGIYRITVERPGFETLSRDGIVLLLGQSLALDFTMALAWGIEFSIW